MTEEIKVRCPKCDAEEQKPWNHDKGWHEYMPPKWHCNVCNAEGTVLYDTINSVSKLVIDEEGQTVSYRKQKINDVICLKALIGFENHDCEKPIYREIDIFDPRMRISLNIELPSDGNCRALEVAIRDSHLTIKFDSFDGLELDDEDEINDIFQELIREVVEGDLL